MFCEFESKRVAIERATARAERQQCPILIMFGQYTKQYRIGDRTETGLLTYGAHVATIHASGLVEYYKAEHEWDVAIGQHCYCTQRPAA